MHKILIDSSEHSEDFEDTIIDLLEQDAILSCYYCDTSFKTSNDCLEGLKVHTLSRHKNKIQALHDSVSSEGFTDESRIEVAHFKITYIILFHAKCAYSYVEKYYQSIG